MAARPSLPTLRLRPIARHVSTESLEVAAVGGFRNSDIEKSLPEVRRRGQYLGAVPRRLSSRGTGDTRARRQWERTVLRTSMESPNPCTVNAHEPGHTRFRKDQFK